MWKVKSFLVLSLLVVCQVSGLCDAAEEQKFGRLFTTPEHRHALDAARGVKQYQNSVAPDKQQEKINSEVGQSVTLSGYIKRNDGKAAVWVNGEYLSSKNRDNSISARPYRLKDHKLRVRAEGKQRILEPGQTWLLPSNKVQEGFQVKANSTTVKMSSDEEY